MCTTYTFRNRSRVRFSPSRNRRNWFDIKICIIMVCVSDKKKGLIMKWRKLCADILFVHYWTLGRGIRCRASQRDAPIYLLSPGILWAGKLHGLDVKEKPRLVISIGIMFMSLNLQNEDGGWGFHIESKSIMFSTALNYICLRMLGVGPDEGVENACKRARQWIISHGGVTYIPCWGKVWLSVNLLDHKLI